MFTPSQSIFTQKKHLYSPVTFFFQLIRLEQSCGRCVHNNRLDFRSGRQRRVHEMLNLPRKLNTAGYRIRI